MRRLSVDERVIWKYQLQMQGGPQWKYQLQMQGGPQEILMPTGAKVVHVDMQRNLVTLWCECDPGAEMEGRSFRIVPTGGVAGVKEHHLGTKEHHLGTAIEERMSGQYVWHIYEAINA
jgi:hypothetical protein